MTNGLSIIHTLILDNFLGSTSVPFKNLFIVDQHQKRHLQDKNSQSLLQCTYKLNEQLINTG